MTALNYFPPLLEPVLEARPLRGQRLQLGRYGRRVGRVLLHRDEWQFGKLANDFFKIIETSKCLTGILFTGDYGKQQIANATTLLVNGTLEVSSLNLLFCKSR